MTLPSKLQIAEHIHWRRFDCELVVLDVHQGAYYGLNEVAAEAFERLASGKKFCEIVTDLLQAYDVDRERLEQDLERTFEDLLNRGVFLRDTT